MNGNHLKKTAAVAICVGVFIVLLIQFYLFRYTFESGERIPRAAAIIGIVINFADLVAVMIAAKAYFDVGSIAYSDVTGINNKLAYREHLKRLDEAENTYYVGIAAFDLNNLKKVNDSLGHEAGDEYIAAFSSVLAGMQKNDVSVYRVGGDEFAVIFEHSNEIVIRQFLNAVDESVDGYNRYRNIKVSYAQGYAVSTPDKYYLVEELTAEADRLMYEDKKKKKQMISEDMRRREI